jgi:hypothetical protein
MEFTLDSHFGKTFKMCIYEICALQGYYAASNGDPLLTFQDNVSVPSSRVKMSEKKMLCNTPEEHISHQHCGGSLKSQMCIYV